VRTRNLVCLICCLAASNVFAGSGFVPEGAEVVPTPAVNSPSPQACPTPTGMQPCETPSTPPSAPWYYWWSSWRWFDNCHDRGQHYPYLPPLPGWYYFRPYSVGQLRAQQEAVMQWGGDPRNPYAGGISQQQPQPQSQPQSQRMPRRETPAPPAPPATARMNAVRPASLEVMSSSVAPSPPTTAGTASIASEPVAVIPWPAALRDARFADQRTRVEMPFRRDLGSQPNLSTADCQSIAEAAEQMKNILWQAGSDNSPQDSLDAERFLNQFIAEARGQNASAEGHAQAVAEQ
jgi:hypothetical protein